MDTLRFSGDALVFEICKTCYAPILVGPRNGSLRDLDAMKEHGFWHDRNPEPDNPYSGDI